MSPPEDPLPSGGEGGEPEADGTPLPSADAGTDEATESEAESPSEEGGDDDEATEAKEPAKDSPTSRGPATAPPGFKFSTFLLIFLLLLGLLMLVDHSEAVAVAGLLSLALVPTVGFGGNHLLTTMFLIAFIEMLMTAIAYNTFTDWIAVAKVGKDGQALRPLQMAALRSGKKSQLDAIKPQVDDLQKRQSSMTINQFKGMAVTWFLLIAIYTWVGLFIVAQCPNVGIAAPATSTTLGTPMLLNSTLSGGVAPYNYSWYAVEGTPQNPGGPVIVGPASTQWSFDPTTAGSYDIALTVSDSRGSLGTSFTTILVGTSPGSLSGGLPAGHVTPAANAATFPSPTGSGCKGTTVTMFGIQVNLLANVWIFPSWFLVFSTYTLPWNVILRRALKHITLAEKLERLKAQGTPPAGGTPT